MRSLSFSSLNCIVSFWWWSVFVRHSHALNIIENWCAMIISVYYYDPIRSFTQFEPVICTSKGDRCARKMAVWMLSTWGEQSDCMLWMERKQWFIPIRLVCIFCFSFSHLLLFLLYCIRPTSLLLSMDQNNFSSGGKKKTRSITHHVDMHYEWHRYKMKFGWNVMSISENDTHAATHTHRHLLTSETCQHMLKAITHSLITSDLILLNALNKHTPCT